MSEAFCKWLDNQPFVFGTGREGRVAGLVWEASRAYTLAEVERIIEELADDAAGGGNAPACQACMIILAAISAMKEGKG